MPKELTHWWLANEALKQLPSECPLKKILEEERAAFLIGAVLPDTLLHLVRGQWSTTALKLGHDFHEPNGNSFIPLSNFVVKTSLTPAIVACLLGIATHIEGDIIFHPFVCALAGDDLGLHYKIETELDLWLLQKGRKPPIWRVKELLTDQISNVAVMVAQGVFDPEGKLPREAFDQGLRLHARIQSMYGAPGWQILAWFLSLLPFSCLKRWQKLFYPLCWQRGRSQKWPEQWHHGTTGQLRGDTPEGLSVNAVHRIVQLFLKIDEEGLLSTFKRHPGENLVTGVAKLRS